MLKISFVNKENLAVTTTWDSLNSFLVGYEPIDGECLNFETIQNIYYDGAIVVPRIRWNMVNLYEWVIVQFENER